MHRFFSHGLLVDLFEQVFSNPHTKVDGQAQIGDKCKVTPVQIAGHIDSTVASEVIDESPNPVNEDKKEGEVMNQAVENQGHSDARLFA